MQLMQQQRAVGSSHARRLSTAAPGTGCARQAVAHALRRGRPDFKPDPTGRLRLYLDSANVTQWELWSSTGLLYGFTTNPAILEKDGVKCNLKSITSLARMGFELGAQEIHLQTWGDSVQRMSSTAFDLAGINVKGVVVKLPCTLEGVQTAALLRESNIRVCITGIYTAHQVLVAQAVGSEYAAPYLGRMNDVYGNNQGMQQVLSMQASISALNSRMRLLVASVREPSELSALSAQGCDTFTISPIVAGKLFNVGYTIDAASDFEAAARRNGGLEDHKHAQAAVEALSSMDGRPRQAGSVA